MTTTVLNQNFKLQNTHNKNSILQTTEPSMQTNQNFNMDQNQDLIYQDLSSNISSTVPTFINQNFHKPIDETEFNETLTQLNYSNMPNGMTNSLSSINSLNIGNVHTNLNHQNSVNSCAFDYTSTPTSIVTTIPQYSNYQNGLLTHNDPFAFGKPPPILPPSSSTTVIPSAYIFGGPGPAPAVTQCNHQQDNNTKSPNSKIVTRPTFKRATDQTGCDVESFLVTTLRQNHRDRLTIYTLEKDMIGFCINPEIYGIRFPKMTSYHRMLVHRIATYFGLDHNVDDTGRQVVCHKGSNTRIPGTRLEDLVKAAEQRDEMMTRILPVYKDCANNSANGGSKICNIVHSPGKVDEPLSKEEIRKLDIRKFDQDYEVNKEREMRKNNNRFSSLDKRNQYYTRNNDYNFKSGMFAHPSTFEKQRFNSKPDQKRSPRQYQTTPRKFYSDRSLSNNRYPNQNLNDSHNSKNSDHYQNEDLHESYEKLSEKQKLSKEQIEKYHDLNAEATAAALTLPKVVQQAPPYIQHILSHQQAQVQGLYGPLYNPGIGYGGLNGVGGFGGQFGYQGVGSVVTSGGQVVNNAGSRQGFCDGNIAGQGGYLANPVLHGQGYWGGYVTNGNNIVHETKPNEDLLTTCRTLANQNEESQMQESQMVNVGSVSSEFNGNSDGSVYTNPPKPLISNALTIKNEPLTDVQKTQQASATDSGVEKSISNSESPNNVKVECQAKSLNILKNDSKSPDARNSPNSLGSAQFDEKNQDGLNNGILAVSGAAIINNIQNVYTTSPYEVSSNSNPDSFVYNNVYNNYVCPNTQIDNQTGQPITDVNNFTCLNNYIQDIPTPTLTCNPQAMLYNQRQLAYLSSQNIISNSIQHQNEVNLTNMGNEVSDKPLAPTELFYYQIEFDAVHLTDKIINRLEAEIILNFLRQQFCGFFYWIPKNNKINFNQDSSGKTMPVKNFTILVAFHPSVAAQAQAEILNKNCNFTLNLIKSDQALKIIGSCEDYNGIEQEVDLYDTTLTNTQILNEKNVVNEVTANVRNVKI